MSPFDRKTAGNAAAYRTQEGTPELSPDYGPHHYAGEWWGDPLPAEGDQVTSTLNRVSGTVAYVVDPDPATGQRHVLYVDWGTGRPQREEARNLTRNTAEPRP